MGFLLSFAYGFILAYFGLSWECWQFWVLLILYFAGILGIYEGSQH